MCTWTQCLPPMHSCVLSDVFHLMHQFPISMQHGLHWPFAHSLWDSFFIPDTKDKKAFNIFITLKWVIWDIIFSYYPKLIFQRIRHHIPPLEELLQQVFMVLMTYGLLKDTTTGRPFFNDRAWEIMETVLENIQRGYHTDPPVTKMPCLHGRNNML
jgi:hypothetical protein